MKMSKILMAGSVMALAATTSQAATQGTLGANSIASSLVQLIIIEEVQINAIDDLLLDHGDATGTANTYQPGRGNVSATTSFCVHYNNGTSVDLTIASANTPGYRITNGTDFITYQLEVDEGANGAPTSHAEAASVTYPLMASTTVGCGGDNNTIRAFFVDTGSPIAGAGNGTYTDTLTYTVIPTP